MKEGKPWLQHYDPEVPQTLVYPRVCILDFLLEQADKYPQKTAIWVNDNSITYQQFATNAQNFARHLIRSGFNPGDRAGICLCNSIEFAVSFMGILMAGGIVAPMNPAFPKPELQFQLAQVHPRFIIGGVEKSQDLISDSNGIQPQNLIFVAEDSEQRIPGFRYFEDFLSPDDDDLSMVKVDPAMSAVIQFSGGTTGTPKAALGSHGNLVANVTQFRHWLVNLQDGQETFLVTIPLYHVYGQVLGLLLGIATAAEMVLVPNPADIDAILQVFLQHKISYIPAVPTIFNRLGNHPQVKNGQIDLSSLKACISGSAPLLESIRINFEKHSGAHLVEGYGLSEAPTATHCNPVLGEKRAHSIGLPLPDVDCRIINAEGEDVVPGEEGELLIRGPQVMQGYLDNPDETARTIVDGWLHTGDMARMDEDGYFYISGRIKDLIKVHGLQVWPDEVEAVLSQHPAIKECAVAGVPDERYGECIMAWVVIKPGESLSLEDLQRFCDGKLVKYKIPRGMIIIQSLPRSAVGKVLRRELIREYLEEKT